jgi:hypothetical protein
MDDGGGGDRLSFLGRRIPPAFELRVVAVAPGRDRAYREAEWRDAIVIVERGQIELESSRGGRRCFGRGDVLWLIGLPLRALHNPGRAPALLVAISRRLPNTRSVLDASLSPQDGCEMDGRLDRIDSRSISSPA